jgi:hypothetical protein
MTSAFGRLRTIIGGIRFEDASYKVHSSITYYPNFVRVYIPKNPYSKLMQGMEYRQPNNRTKIGSRISLEDNIERAVRRTRRRINDYLLCNDFDLFTTFTFDPSKVNRHDPNACKTKMSDWLKNQQKIWGKFRYLIVPEFHKDKTSLHFHALLGNYAGHLKNSNIKHNGRTVYNITSYRSGFSTAVKIDNKEKVASYVQKYITKDMPTFFGKNRYWVSKGLKLPLTIENSLSDEWDYQENSLWSHENEYGLTIAVLNSFVPASVLHLASKDSPGLAISELGA